MEEGLRVVSLLFKVDLGTLKLVALKGLANDAQFTLVAFVPLARGESAEAVSKALHSSLGKHGQSSFRFFLLEDIVKLLGLT